MPRLAAGLRENWAFCAQAGKPVAVRKLTGAPDLIAEVLSPANRAYDQHQKRERYQRAGVREFWVVDPDAQCVEQFVLRHRTYVLLGVMDAELHPRIVRGVRIDLTAVW